MTFPSHYEPAIEFEPVLLDVLFPLSAKSRLLRAAPPVATDSRQHRAGETRRRQREADRPLLSALTSEWQTPWDVGKRIGIARTTARMRLEAGVTGGWVERKQELRAYGRRGRLTVWYRTTRIGS